MTFDETAELALRRQYAALSSLTDAIRHLEDAGRLRLADQSGRTKIEMFAALAAAVVERHMLSIMTMAQVSRATGHLQREIYEDRFTPGILEATIRTVCARRPELGQWIDQDTTPEEGETMTNTTTDAVRSGTTTRGLRESDMADLKRIFGAAHREAAKDLPAAAYALMEGSIRQQIDLSVSKAMRFATEPNRAIVATSDQQQDRMTGFAALCQVSEHEGEVKNVVVDPTVQRQGTGRALMDALEDAARESGYTSVVLWTYRHLHAARQMYENRGYAEEHNENAPPDMDPDLDPLFMRLPL